MVSYGTVRDIAPAKATRIKRFAVVVRIERTLTAHVADYSTD